MEALCLRRLHPSRECRFTVVGFRCAPIQLHNVVRGDEVTSAKKGQPESADNVDVWGRIGSCDCKPQRVGWQAAGRFRRIHSSLEDFWRSKNRLADNRKTRNNKKKEAGPSTCGWAMKWTSTILSLSLTGAEQRRSRCKQTTAKQGHGSPFS